MIRVFASSVSVDESMRDEQERRIERLAAAAKESQGAAHSRVQEAVRDTFVCSRDTPVPITNVG